MDLAQTYAARYSDVLCPCAAALESILRGYLAGIKRIDRVAVRAKDPDSFIKKASKEENGKRHYSDPLGQIQDQIGARVVVLYTTDIEPVGDRILKYCRHIEIQTKEPESDTEFGYFGKHYVLALPTDCVPAETDTELAPKFFELQVRTLFQHASSESTHDPWYKPVGKLTADQKRRFAFIAAQAWGADRVLDELVKELGTAQVAEPGKKV